MECVVLTCSAPGCGREFTVCSRWIIRRPDGQWEAVCHAGHANLLSCNPFAAPKAAVELDLQHKHLDAAYLVSVAEGRFCAT